MDIDKERRWRVKKEVDCFMGLESRRFHMIIPHLNQG